MSHRPLILARQLRYRGLYYWIGRLKWTCLPSSFKIADSWPSNLHLQSKMRIQLPFLTYCMFIFFPKLRFKAHILRIPGVICITSPESLMRQWDTHSGELSAKELANFLHIACAQGWWGRSRQSNGPEILCGEPGRTVRAAEKPSS